jgi:uncharacterized protein YbjQ (UPF0145 family)
MQNNTKILITTTEHIAGREIAEVLGLVEGNTIQTRHLGSHIVAGLRALVGGEVKGYVRAVSAARAEATARMVASASVLGADAIICMRYSSAQIMNGGAEILVYGTAVKLR